jgi:hypothetical protein
MIARRPGPRDTVLFVRKRRFALVFSGSLALALPAITLVTQGSAEAQVAPQSPEALTVSDVKLTPALEIRTRGEYRRDSPELGGIDGGLGAGGRETPRVRDAWGIFERTRLGVTAEREVLVAKITLQDARAWGVPFPSGTLVPPSSSQAGSFGAHEAYIEVRSSSAKPSFLRLGRQTIVWGDGALIGAADWSPRGRSFDALRGRTQFGVFGADAFAALLEPSAPLGPSSNETAGLTHSGVSLFGLKLDAAVAPIFKLEVYGLAKIARSDGSELDGSRFQAARASGELYAAGLRAFGESSGWSYSAEGTYEVGTAAALAAQDVAINAYAAHGRLKKKLDDVPWTPTLGLGFAYASGDDGSGTYKQFDPLFADPHQYGVADVFALSNHIEGSAVVSVVPMTDVTLSAEYRYARLEAQSGEWLNGYLSPIGTLAGPSGTVLIGGPGSTIGSTAAADKELGHEMSLVMHTRPWRGLDLAAGYDFFLYGDGARTVMSAYHRGFANGNGYAPSSFGQFAYLSATLKL